MSKVDLIIKEEIEKYLDTIFRADEPIKRVELIEGFPIGWFYSYIPKDRDTEDVGDAVRQFIWCFKNDVEEDYTFTEYMGVRQKAVQLITNTLKGIFSDEELREIVVAFVPCSSSDNYVDRWCIFGDELCLETSMINSFDSVFMKTEAIPNHYGGGGYVDISIEKKMFKGRKVIVIDDLLTTGQHMMHFVKQLEKIGAHPLMGLTFAKTVEDKKKATDD